MGRLVTERSKEVASIASGAGLPSASGCKDPMYQEVLSPPLLKTMFRSIFYARAGCRSPIGTHPRPQGKHRSNQCHQESIVHISFLTETNLDTNIKAARGYRRTPGNRRSKEASSATSGVGLPSASGCKDPMYQDLLSLSNAPERCSGAF